MDNLIHICIGLVVLMIVDYTFRKIVVNPTLESKGVEPYRYIKHAKYRYITDIFKFVILSPKDIKGVISILISLGLQVSLIWLLFMLAGGVSKLR